MRKRLGAQHVIYAIEGLNQSVKILSYRYSKIYVYAEKMNLEREQWQWKTVD